MNETRDIEPILDIWLGDDGSMLPDRVIDASLAQIDSTPQRRVLIRVPWRFPIMNSYAKLGAAAVVAVVLVGGAIALLRPDASSTVGDAPSAVPSAAPLPSTAPPSPVAPSAAPTPAATPIGTADWQTFTSERYGYTVAYPASHTGLPGSTVSAPTSVDQAQRDFTFGTDRFEATAETSAPLDWIIVGPDGSQIAFGGFAATIPAGTSVDDVITQSFPPCSLGWETEPITIDGHPGRLDVCGNDISIAVAIVGDRAYVFNAGYGGIAKDLMTAYLSTVKLPTS
jgi:hypothetical protein